MTTKHIYTGKSIIRHRINTIDLLNTVPSEFGIEFDVRESYSGIIVTHDPWSEGIRLDEFLPRINHSFCIVNIKSEGIEFEVLRLLETHNIHNFFLLDCSFPMIIRLSKSGERRLAIRVSEYESIENAINMKGMVDWIWLDSFIQLPSKHIIYTLKTLGFKICVVSPELQGRTYIGDISDIKNIVDAVCTKYPTLWY